MPNFIAALCAVVLSLLGFLPGGLGSAGFDTARTAALAVVTIFLAWQAYALLRQRASAAGQRDTRVRSGREGPGAARRAQAVCKPRRRPQPQGPSPLPAATR